MLTTARHALLHANPVIRRSALAALSTVAANRLVPLCQANANVIADKIHVIDKLIERKHGAGANQVYTADCPVTGTTMGKQFRHSLDHLEKVALDGLR